LTDGKIDSSPLVMNETVVFGSFDGNLYLANLSDGKILQKINLGGEIAGSPIFCRDGIFIGTLKGDLYKLVPKQP
jgi:outer membrane protein assembly factor BamB